MKAEWGREELEAALPFLDWRRDEFDSMQARLGFMTWEWLRGATAVETPCATLRLAFDRADGALHEEEAFCIEREVHDLADVEMHAFAMSTAALAYINALRAWREAR